MRKFKLLFTLVSMMLIGTGGLFAQPANDLCVNAQSFVDGDVFTVNTNTATAADNPGTCITFLGGTEEGVWYTITGVDGIIGANTCGAGTGFDTKLTAWSGSCGALTCVTGNDDFCGLQSGISFQAEAAETYYIHLTGFGGAQGTAEVAFSVFSIDPEDFASNDFGYGINGSSDSLYRIELSTGDVEGVGVLTPNPGGFQAGGEIVGNQLFFTTSADGNLYGADTATAAVSTIGATGIANVTSLELDPTTGTLYGINVVCGTSTSLYTVDPGTGATTLVGTSTDAGCGVSLSIDDNGLAYVVDIVTDAIIQVDLADFSTISSAPLTDASTGAPLNLNFGQNTDFDCSEDSQLLFGILFDANLFDNRFGALDPMTGIFTELDFEDIPAFGNWGTFAIACGEAEEVCGGGYTVNLSAITSVNVTLDGACQGKLTPRMVLVGDFDTDDDDDEDDPAPDCRFDIVVQDGDPSNGMIIDGCGTFIWTATNNDPDSLSGFTSAWGYVNAEDKTSPTLVDSLEAPAELFCSEIENISIANLPSNVSRCWIQDGQSIATLNSSMSPILRARLLAGGTAVGTGGIPDFFDGCSDVEICVNDLVQNNGQCEDLIITRVFTATDGISCTSISGEENEPTVYSYDIIFTTPSVDDVEGVDSLAQFSCSDNFPTLPANAFGDENPTPTAEDFPFLLRADGTNVFLSAEGFCNLGAAFQDGPRIVTCENTYKFVRTFTVIDWCDVNNIETFTQLVKVGDFDAPVITAPTQDLDFDGVPDGNPLFFSTNTPDCASVFVVPAGSAVDNCDASPSVSVVIYPGGDTLAVGFGPFAVGAPVGVAIPLGDHLMRYFAVDNCGNTSSIDVDITIGDATAPVAICEDGLNISIGGPNDASGGTAELCAVDVNRASYDDCSEIDLDIRITEINGVPVTPNNPLFAFQDCHTLRCTELGTIEVELRVTDDANDNGLFEAGIDNTNFCWLDVLVEDKTPPICIAPGPVVVTCDDLAQDFPQDLNIEVAIDPVGTFALLDAQFGLATGLDNCPDPVITQTVSDGRNSCGVGSIIRTFTVTDAEGFTSPPGCIQVITVLGIHDYTVVFPGDQESDDCVEPNYNGVTYTEFGCDLITVSADIDTFTASADECYKLRVNYEVLNWCEYNTIDPAYMIPRDADNDGILDMDITVLHVIPNGAGDADDLAYLDRDENRNNFNTIGNLDTGDGGVVVGSDVAGYGLDGSRGAFTYFQFIKVYDDTPPTLVVVDPDSAFCSFTNDCVADVELNYSIDDECSPESVNSTVELDQFIGAGTYTLAQFSSDVDITGNVTNNGDGSFDIDLANVPIGRHAVRIVATDGCGNTAIDLIIFEVTDCKAPTPICINGLTATLMPDGDGGGMAAIWASDFIASPSFDCSGIAGFAIYRDGEQPDAFTVENAQDTGLVLTCDDLGPLAVRIYAIDNFGQADYCLTMLLVQAFAPGVCSGGEGELAGVVATPADDMMSGVTVNISNTNMTDAEITTNGLYQFTGLEAGDDYTVEPVYNPAVNLSTVTTADLIMISRHILGLEELTGQYQLLAANANQDAGINILDIISIRRVILGLDAEFQATNSWRFYVAGDANNAETFTQNNLEGSIAGIDFVAVEIANVTDASANFTAPIEGRGTMGLDVKDVDMTAGNTYEVNFSAADMAGFQGTLELGAGVELTDVRYGVLEAGNFNLTNAAQGLIAVSYNGEAGDLFTLSLRATTDAKLSNMISMGDRITAAEAYGNNGEVANLNINFTNGTVVAADFALEQNTPNPFADRTKIGFNLPTAATVSLTVQDVQGRTLLVREIEGAAGYNSTELTTAELKGATGVLSYTIVAGELTATRKLVVLK